MKETEKGQPVVKDTQENEDVLEAKKKQVLKGGGNTQVCKMVQNRVCKGREREKYICGYVLLFQLRKFLPPKFSVSPAMW